MKITITVFVFLLIFPLSVYSVDSELFAQGKKLSNKCVFCHGENGKAPNNIIPNLAGQNEAYLLKQLKDFRSRRRFNSAMRQVSMGLEVDELKALAYYFSQLSP